MEAVAIALLGFFGIILGIVLVLGLGTFFYRMIVIKLITSSIRDIGQGIGGVVNAFKNPKKDA